MLVWATLVWGCGGVERVVERDVERGVERAVELGVERVDTDLLPLSLRGDWLLGGVFLRDDSERSERRALAFGTSGSRR